MQSGEGKSQTHVAECSQPPDPGIIPVAHGGCCSCDRARLACFAAGVTRESLDTTEETEPEVLVEMGYQPQ